MKKFLLFFIIFLQFGCDSIPKKDRDIKQIKCPKVFFSSENSTYSIGDLDSFNLDDIEFKAAINNYEFTEKCFSDKKSNYYLLDLLILVEPINPSNSNISLPIFVILYDDDDNIIDKYFYRISADINYSEKVFEYLSTEVIGNLDVVIDRNVQVSSVTVGFIKINN